jgi:tetratricopeptide (TPR) repeat protein
MSRVRAGVVPPLAGGHVTRAEISSALAGALRPGLSATLVPSRRLRRLPDMPRHWQGASGKTQAAVAYAEELWATEGIDILVWVTATSRAAVLSTLAEAAVAVGTRAASLAAGGDEVMADRFLEWLRETTRPWLVVLDDLADPAVMADGWPEGAAGRTLITTPDPGALPGRHRGTEIPVGPFSPRQSLDFLMGRLTADLDQRQGAVDLVGDLGHEPLALAQASAVIVSSEMSCRGYLDAVGTRRARSATERPPAAALTWWLAVEHADALIADLAHAQLVFTALLDGNGIPGTVYVAATRPLGVPENVIGEGLAALETAGLLSVDRSVTPPLVRMNWAVRAAILAAAPADLLATTARAAADALLDAWPEADQPDHVARAFRSCAESLQLAAGRVLWHDGCHGVLPRCGRSLEAAGLAGPAADYWNDLAAASDQALGANHPDTVGIRGRLALTRMASGQPDQAIALFHSVLADRAATLGRDHAGTAQACQDLGRALLAAGRAAEAITVLDDAVACYEQAAGPGSGEAAAAQEDLAAAHAGAGHAATAITLYRHALGIRQRVAGPAHPDTLATCRKLADAYLADGQVKNAISLVKRTLDECEKSLGSMHPETIGARGALASAYFAAGRMPQALQLLEQVRSQYAAAIGTEHRTTLACSLNLASAYQSVGRLTDAVRLRQDTVERCERSLPDTDSLVIAARASLGGMTGPGRSG